MVTLGLHQKKSANHLTTLKRLITLLPFLVYIMNLLVIPRLLRGVVKFNYRQFGFTFVKSTIGAIMLVRKTVISSELKYVLGRYIITFIQ